MNRSTPGLPIQHQLLEFTQTHVHRVGDAIQPSHPLSSPSPAPNPSQHQGLFQWINSSHEVAKVLEFSASASVLPMNYPSSNIYNAKVGKPCSGTSSHHPISLTWLPISFIWMFAHSQPFRIIFHNISFHHFFPSNPASFFHSSYPCLIIYICIYGCLLTAFPH